MPATIVGIGTALPPHRIARSDSEEFTRGFCCQSDEHRRSLAAIFRRATVATRHSVLLESSSDEPSSRQSFYGEANPTTARRTRASDPIA
jgi:predicted naringenin-chalcone synthase